MENFMHKAEQDDPTSIWNPNSVVGQSRFTLLNAVS
jgi:hypothetical protein